MQFRVLNPTSSVITNCDVFTRWCIVIHGCIDGYSHRIMYSRASDNNAADTLLTLFVDAVQQFGLPSHVRGDRGGENTGVADYMISHPQRDPGHSSFIAVRSVHNQRIERIWQDVNSSCTHLFYDLFYYLEERFLLDPENEISPGAILCT